MTPTDGNYYLPYSLHYRIMMQIVILKECGKMIRSTKHSYIGLSSFQFILDSLIIDVISLGF